jgi:hypothetical protein
MKRYGHVPSALAITLTVLLTLASLATSGTRPASAAGQATEKILVSIANDDTWLADTLYTLNPDGSGQTKLFDFQNHPHDSMGRIWQPRVAPDGATIYFSSSNAKFWTPASRNLFRIAADGSWWDQITPDPNSGLWDQPGPYGIVEGTVKKSNGDPWSGAPIFLEGMSMIYSGADGSFRFENVPEGKRWIVAYEPGGSSIYDSQEIQVVAGLTWTADLVPSSDVKMEHQYPAQYGDRIYHKLGINQIVWTDVDASAYHDIYTISGACGGIPNVDGFDVSSSGKLAIMDYWQGCAEHDGLYTADEDGQNMQLLVDMKADANWCGAQEVFWSPDESKLAFKGCYSWYTYVLVYDASNGYYLDGIYFPDTSYTLINVDLHGWSPDGNGLLYSYWLDPLKVSLEKIEVNSDGSLGTSTTLLTDIRLSGATWGNLNPVTCAVPLTGVEISGPTTGKINTTYTFTASPQPANATSPTYTWSPAPDSGQGTATAKYSWTATGDKTITLQAVNCGGVDRSDTHVISIGSEADYYVFLPLTVRDFP